MKNENQNQPDTSANTADHLSAVTNTENGKAERSLKEAGMPRQSDQAWARATNLWF